MGNRDGFGDSVAILRADIVGSTDILSSRGVDVAIEMQQSARAAIERVCSSGTLLEYRGDGSLIAFRSASEALEAAWRLRDAVAKQDFQLRIAVTLEEPPVGELLSQRMQQRTESFEARCRPGMIVADDRIMRAVRGHDEAAFDDLEPDGYTLRAFGAHETKDRTTSAVRTVLFTEPLVRNGRGERVAASITTECVEKHGGFVVNTNGGRFMTTFRSCADALRAADAIHTEAASRNARSEEPDGISFRIAASVGEVVETADDSFGIAVIEAARLVAKAGENATLTSRDVADLAGLEVTEANHRGLVLLKGLADPVDVVRLEHDGAIPPLLELPQLLDLDRDRPMVGRRDQYLFLQERLDASLEGVPSAVVVSGEEGIGKTRLVRELAAKAHADGLIVLHGACENDPRAPFAPIVDALERAAHLDPSIEFAVSEGGGSLGSLFGAARSTATSEIAPTRLEQFGAVAETLSRLCIARPVLLVLDDIQWASNDLARLMADVLDALGSARILVVFTHRSEGSVSPDALDDLLSGAHQRVRRHLVPLRRLDDLDVVSMIEARTDRRLALEADSLATAISKITGGSPLYIDELLTHLMTTHVLVEDPALGWALTVDVAELSPPSSIVDLMTRRIARLGTEACGALGVAALMGSSFDLETLATVTGHDVGHILEMVETAVGERLLRSADDEGSRAFSDEIARAAFLRHVPSSRRALVHEQLAVAIEDIRPDQFDELIVHWSGAVGRNARRQVIHYLRITTDRDMSAAAWESVVERSHALLDMLEADELEDQCEARLMLGTALRLLGEDSHRPELTKAADLARQLSDPDRLFRAAAGMMRPGEWIPEAGVVDDEIVGMCEDVLLLVGDASHPTRIRALAALATNLAYDSDPQRRLDLVAEAQKAARDSNDLRLLGSALVAELLSELRPDAFERRRAVADEIRRIGRATNDADLLFTGSFYSMLDAIERGAIELAESLLEQLRTITASKRDFYSRYRIACLDAAMAVARSEPDAQERIDAAHQMADGEPVDSFAPLVLQTATLAMYRGTLTEILLPIAQAADMWDDSWSRRWDFALAKAYLDTGEHELASETVRANPEPVADSFWLSSYCQLAEVGWLLGFPDLCHRAIEQLTPFRGRFALIGGGLSVSGLVSVAIGQASLGLGELADAEAFFREAIADADAAGFPFFATNARRLLAETLLTIDPASQEADGLLHVVLDDSGAHDFKNEQQRANELLNN